MKPLLFLIFALSSLTVFAESPEDKLRAAITKCFISIDPNDPEETEKLAPRLIEHLFGGDKLVLSASQKSDISSGKLKVDGYEETLKSIKIASTVSPKIMGNLPEYASKKDLTDLEKLAVQKFMEVIQVQANRTASTMALTSAKAAAAQYITLKTKNGKAPVKISELGLEDAFQFRSPVDGELKDWILVEPKTTFKIDGQDVVILAPEAIDGKRAAGMADGAAKFVAEEDVPKALKSE